MWLRYGLSVNEERHARECGEGGGVGAAVGDFGGVPSVAVRSQVAWSDPKWVVQRAGIVVLAWEWMSNQGIACEVSLNRLAVGTWRRRWRDACEELTLLECSELTRLRAAIRETLKDAPRPGCPGTFTAEQVTQILAVAGEPPEKSGRPITHWTKRELRDEVVKRNIVSRISESQVGHYLRTAALQPHRRKMWINTTQKDPVIFERQVAEVCQTYQEAVPRHETD